MIQSACRPGFTLLEMLLTSALTSVLMIALLGVTHSLARGQSQILDTDDSTQWLSQIKYQLQQDLIHAKRWTYVDGALGLEGHVAIDAAGHSTHQSAQIWYRVIHNESYFTLVRDQQLVRPSIDPGPERILLGWDIGKIRVNTPTASNVDNSLTEPIIQWHPIPATIAVQLHRPTSPAELDEPIPPLAQWRLHGQ